MLHRKLGNTGIAVSKIALGTMYFGSETPEVDAFAILDAFVEADGNLIDTANVYVGGVSEQIIGRWFAARPHDVTDRVVLATKGRFGPGPDVNAVGLSRRHLHRAQFVDEVLRVIGFVGTQRDRLRSIGARLDHVQRRDPLGVAVGWCQAGVDHQAVAVLHQGMAHEAELRFLAGPFAIERRLGIRGRGVRVI